MRRDNSSRLVAPGEMLVLDPNGILVILNELDDEAARKELTKAEDEAAARKAAAPPAP